MPKRKNLEEKVDEVNNELGEIKATLQKYEREIFYPRYGLGDFRTIFGIIFAALAIIITTAIVLFAIFGVTSFRDIQSIAQMGKDIERMKNEVDKVSAAIKKASLTETIPIHSLGSNELGINDSPDYDPRYYLFVKQKSYTAIRFFGEIQNLDVGDTAYIKLFVADSTDTIFSEEEMITSSDYHLVELKVPIMELKNGRCGFAYAARNVGKEGIGLRNVNVFIYSKLFDSIDDKGE